MVKLEFQVKLHDRSHGDAVTLRLEEEWPHPPSLGDRVALDDVVGALGHTAPVERIEWRRGGTALVELGNHRVDDLELALRLLDAWQPVAAK